MRTKRPVSRRDLDFSNNKGIGNVFNYSIDPRANQRWSKSSSVDIFEVTGGFGTILRSQNHEQLQESIEKDTKISPLRLRV